MKIIAMTDAETKAHLLRWCESPDRDLFAWPTDACGYSQHMRFVHHRNHNYAGATFEEWIEFVRSYAESLCAVPSTPTT